MAHGIQIVIACGDPGRSFGVEPLPCRLGSDFETRLDGVHPD